MSDYEEEYCQLDELSRNGEYQELDIILSSESFNASQLTYTEKAMDSASARGHVKVLDVWFKYRNKLTLKYSDYSLELASANCQIQVLDWWKQSKLPPMYSREKIIIYMWRRPVLDWWHENRALWPYDINTHEISRVSMNNMVIIEWCFDHGYLQDSNFFNSLIMGLSVNGHTLPLDWIWEKISDWNAPELEFSTEPVIDCICTDNYSCSFGECETLDWFMRKRDSLPFRFTSKAMDEAVSISILDWWLDASKQGLVTLKYTEKSTARIDLEILNWWFDKHQKNILPMKYSSSAVMKVSDFTIDCPDTELIDWFWDRRDDLPQGFPFPPDILDSIYKVHVLDWFRSRFPDEAFVYSGKALTYCSEWQHVESLEWWKNSGLELKVDKEDIKKLLESYNDRDTPDKEAVIAWWKQNEHLLQ